MHLVGIARDPLSAGKAVERPGVDPPRPAEDAVAILYGRAREVPGSLRDTRPGRSGAARKVVTIEVALTRAYAMRAPEPAPGAAPPRS